MKNTFDKVCHQLMCEKWSYEMWHQIVTLKCVTSKARKQKKGVIVA